MPDLALSINIALTLTIIGLVAGCVRMLKGPSAADRIVSLDFVTVLLIAITSLLALQLDNSAYLDLGLALALIGFLATVAFARYVESNEPRRDTAEAHKPTGFEDSSDKERNLKSERGIDHL